MITAQIASIPERENILQIAVNSLINQVDKINIMLNGHKDVPIFLKQLEFHTDKLNYYAMNNSTGDAAKFFQVEKVKGYFFSCDDDIQYPPDYVRVMIAKLQQYDNKIILTNHGRVMNEKPVSSIYTDRKSTHHTFMEVKEDTEVDIGGTGVMAFHTDYFKPIYKHFLRANMADIWIAKFAKEQGLKIIVNPHHDRWLIPLDLNPNLSSIWKSKYGKDKLETEIYNSF